MLLFLLTPAIVLFAQEPMIKEETLGYQQQRVFWVQEYKNNTGDVLGVLVLHGATTEENFKSLINNKLGPWLKEFSQKKPLVVVYPLGLPGRCPVPKENICWPFRQPWEDIPFLKDVIEKVSRQHALKRWIAIGISNGGYYLASVIQSGERLPISDVINIIGGKGWWFKPKAVWQPNLYILAGNKDKENRANARMLYRELKKTGYGGKAALSYEEFQGGHEIPFEKLAQLLEKIAAVPPQN
ncbi:MAG: hypothetical protein AAB091_07845 [Elusimicrobiota bacterium]